MSREVISRQTAQLKGKKRFYTGEPCVHGHDSERYVSSGGCIDCQNFKTLKTNVRGRNVSYPEHPFIFTAPVQPHEMQAAFNYMRELRWHDYAVTELRKNPALMEQYAPKISGIELAKLEAQVAQARRHQPRGTRAVVYNLECSHQRVTGNGLEVGQKVQCRYCNAESTIVSILDRQG